MRGCGARISSRGDITAGGQRQQSNAENANLSWAGLAGLGWAGLGWAELGWASETELHSRQVRVMPVDTTR